MGSISRGFTGRRSASDVKLPPGQYLTNDFPVLSAGPTPRVSLDQWQFTINEGTNVLRRWNWKSFRELPTEAITVDIHCVTRWSKLGTHWEGVSLDTMFADVKTDASHALVHSYGGYTTNLPLTQQSLRDHRHQSAGPESADHAIIAFSLVNPLQYDEPRYEHDDRHPPVRIAQHN